MIVMREQLSVKQRQAISETPAKDGGGLVETCFCHLAGWSPFRSSDLGSAVAFRVQYSSSATRAVWIISPVKRVTGWKIGDRIMLFAAAAEAASNGEEQTQTSP